MYYDIANQRPIRFAEIRKEHPNTSIPDGGDLSDLGYYKLIEVAPPQIDPMTQRVARDHYTLDDTLHTATETWVIEPLSTEEIAENAERAKQQLVTDIINATQQRLDDFARTRSYDDVNSLAKYKDITDAEIATLSLGEQPLVTKFRAECRYLALKVAQTWATLYTIMAEVEAGTRPIPTSFADIEPDLPPLEWPT